MSDSIDVRIAFPLQPCQPGYVYLVYCPCGFLWRSSDQTLVDLSTFFIILSFTYLFLLAETGQGSLFFLRQIVSKLNQIKTEIKFITDI